MRLVVNRGKARGRSITVTGPRFVIGRAPECQLRPASDLVSRRHAELRFTSGVPTIADLGSEAGTRVNGRAVSEPVALRDGDRIEIGPLCFTAVVGTAPSARPARQSREDMIVAWLTEGDDEFAEAPTATTHPRGDVGALGPRRGTNEHPDQEALDLLREMTARNG